MKSKLIFVLLAALFIWVTNVDAKEKLTAHASIVSVLPKKIIKRLNTILKHNEMDASKYSNLKDLHAKVEDLEQILLQALRAKGYYSAYIVSDIEKKKNSSSVTVKFNIFPGEVFILKEIRVESKDKEINIPKIADLALTLNKPLEAKKVLEAEKILAYQLELLNCLASIEISYQAVLDDLTSTAILIFNIKPAPQAKFGPIIIKGLKTVDNLLIQKKIKLEQDACFKLSRIEETRTELLASKFFAKVDIKFDEIPNEVGQIPIIIEFTERLHKTIKVGAGYGSDEGIGGSTSWEHRNFWGEGEIFKIDISANKLRKKVDTTYTEPYFLRDDQSLILSSKLLQENLDAYDALSWKLTGTIQRKFSHKWIASVGGGYTVSQVKKINEENEIFGLIRFPLGLKQDTRNNLLDPNKGHQLNMEWIPYFDSFNSNVSFNKTVLEGIQYVGFTKTKFSPVIAIRGLTGFITGDTLLDIPADERFYAGGGGTVRGYGFQKLSRFSSGKPLGGRSIIVLSSELRLHYFKKFGGVFFVDGGNTYEEKYPNFEEPLRWAVGTGIRYYTGFGPIRFDIALPIAPRPQVDNHYQFYISLGQAY